jgi:hypothetical protein
MNARNGKNKLKSIVTTESFVYIYLKNGSSGELLKSLKSEKLYKSLCLTANEGLNLPFK